MFEKKKFAKSFIKKEHLPEIIYFRRMIIKNWRIYCRVSKNLKMGFIKKEKVLAMMDFVNSFDLRDICLTLIELNMPKNLEVVFSKVIKGSVISWTDFFTLDDINEMNKKEFETFLFSHFGKWLLEKYVFYNEEEILWNFILKYNKIL